MNNREEIQSNILQIIRLSDQMINIITNAHICFDSLSFLNGIFQETKLKMTLIDPNDNTIEHLTKVRETCEKFLIILKFLHKFIWPEASLLINVRDIFDAISEFMDSLSMKLYDFKECIELSLQSLINYYQNPSFNKNYMDLAKLQLNQISTIISELSNKGTYLPSSDPLPPLKEWNFDNKPEEPVENACFNDYPLKLIKREDGEFLELEIDQVVSKEKYLKQLLLLSSLKKNVLSLINASFEGDKIKCAFQYAKSMYTFKQNLIPIYKKQSKNSLSKVVYKIAEALGYLHERGVVHGNLCLESIIFQLSNIIKISLWNFGLFNKKVDPRIIPLELTEESKSNNYTISTDNYMKPQTDVYQYGLLLYQIAKDIKEDTDLKEIKKNDYNYDEKLKKHCSNAMINLIKDCLNSDPKQRPTFSQIITRFHVSQIDFAGSDPDSMNLFYFDERFRGLKKDIADKTFNIILREVKDYPECKEKTVKGLCHFLDWLFDMGKIGEEKRNKCILNLDRFCFFEQIIQFFDVNDDEIKKNLVERYINIFQPDIQEKVFGNKSIKHEFLKNGGVKYIIDYMKNEKSKNLSFLLLDQIIDSLNDEFESSLSKIIPELVNYKEIKYISKIINLQGLTTDCKIRVIKPSINNITPLYKESDLSNDVSDIVKFYLQHQDESAINKDITDINYIYSFQDLMKLGDVPLLRQLMRYQSFLSSISNQDITEAVNTIITDDADQKQKECSLLLCISLGDPFFQFVSSYNDLIDTILSNPNQELASRFIARITLYSLPCDYILSRIEENDDKSPFKVFTDCKNPWYILCLTRIAGFYATRVSKITNLKENLIRNIDQASNIEDSLRLLGVLSKEAEFWNDLKVAKSLINLLHNNLSTPFEKTILLSLISNLVYIDETKQFFSNTTNYFIFISEVEKGGKLSGLALRILSRLEIPDQLERDKDTLINRLTIILKTQLQNGDKFGIEGSSQLINNMLNHYKETPENALVINNYMNIDIVNLLILASKKEQNINIFTKLMESLYSFEQKSHPELISLFLNMIMNNKNREYDYEKFDNLMKLMSH